MLIDWVLAKRYWRKFHCTGGEAASVQLKVLSKESDYLWLEKLNNKRGGGDGGLGVVPLPEPILN
ncbi:MAG: hypothetical protein PHQ60_02310 [Sideroxydans sp.]|nr:hypothetical protein [Sideroxydans sp.]MDD5056677.1 hypothetical protein [Sideroxydans sp.]